MHPGKMCVNRVRLKTEDKCPGELVEPEEEEEGYDICWTN